MKLINYLKFNEKKITNIKPEMKQTINKKINKKKNDKYNKNSQGRIVKFFIPGSTSKTKLITYPDSSEYL